MTAFVWLCVFFLACGWSLHVEWIDTPRMIVAFCGVVSVCVLVFMLLAKVNERE